jgi:hypothetical protein
MSCERHRAGNEEEERWEGGDLLTLPDNTPLLLAARRRGKAFPNFATR